MGEQFLIKAVYVGPTNITGEVGRFQSKFVDKSNGTLKELLNGEFGADEKIEYTKLLTFLKNKKYLSAEETGTFKAFVDSECSGSRSKDPVVLALMEKLVAYIESDQYSKTPKNIRDGLAYFATDVHKRIKAETQNYVLEDSPKYSTSTSVEDVGPLKPNDELGKIASKVPYDCENVLNWSADESQAKEDNPGHLDATKLGERKIGPYMTTSPNKTNTLQLDPRYL